MEVITYTQALKNLDIAIGKVSNDHIQIMITSEHHKPVVIMSLEDFNTWQETAHLMQSPANAKDLLEAVIDVEIRRNLVKQDRSH